MGYRSEWKLAIAAADETVRDAMLKWMTDYATVEQQGISEEQRNVMDLIISSELERSETHLMFGDGSTKCYDPWDSVISDIIEHADNDEELDVGYARIGEEYDDMETRGGSKCGVYPSIIRDIDGFDIEIPSKKSAMPTVASTVQRCEEKCPSCGRMKDAGQKCWWCGH